MAYTPKPKRLKKFYQCDLYADQLDTMRAISAQTGRTVTDLVRDAIDKAYPPNKINSKI